MPLESLVYWDVLGAGVELLARNSLRLGNPRFSDRLPPRENRCSPDPTPPLRPSERLRDRYSVRAKNPSYLVLGAGVEPATYRSSGGRSTN